MMIRGLVVPKSALGVLVFFFAAACSEGSSFSGAGGKGPASKGAEKNAGDATAGNEAAGSDEDSDEDSDEQTAGDTSPTGERPPLDPALSDLSESDGDGPSGSPGTDPAAPQSVTSTFIGQKSIVRTAVDIIFVMDTSGSMSQEKASLEANMSAFISRFETDARKADYQVFMLGANFNFPAGGEKVIKINQAVGSNDALVILQRFFDGTILSPRPLRPDSIKQIVVVTDDDASTLGADFKTYIQSMDFLKGKTSVNGFVGLPTSATNAACEIASIGDEYITLASDPEVGGLLQDLCVQDWSRLLKDLADKIIKETIRGDFILDQPADPSKDVIVTVDGATLTAAQVKYDEIKNTIVFTPGNEPPAGAEIVVVYTPKS